MIKKKKTHKHSNHLHPPPSPHIFSFQFSRTKGISINFLISFQEARVSQPGKITSNVIPRRDFCGGRGIELIPKGTLLIGFYQLKPDHIHGGRLAGAVCRGRKGIKEGQSNSNWCALSFPQHTFPISPSPGRRYQERKSLPLII